MLAYPQNAILQNQVGPALGSNYDQQLQHAEKDSRPRLGELIVAAHDAIDAFEMRMSNLECTVVPLMDGAPVDPVGTSGMPAASNPAYVDELMRLVLRIHTARSRIDSMASRLRI